VSEPISYKSFNWIDTPKMLKKIFKEKKMP